MTAKILGWKYVDRVFQLGQSWQFAPAGIMVLLVASLLAACGGGGAAAPSTEQPATAATATALTDPHDIASDVKDDLDLPEIDAHDDFDKPCDDGVLTVAEVGTLDDWWKSSFDAIKSDAMSWQSDAQLVRASVMCWYGDQPDLQTTYKSEAAGEGRDFPETDAYMGGTILDPMDASLVSFTKLHDSLIDAGFTDETIITGIDMSELHFAHDAEGIGGGLFYYHVGEYDPDGDARDVSINTRDGSFEFGEN